MNLKGLLAKSRGIKSSDLVIKNVKVPNLFTNEIIETDVAVSQGYIVGVDEGYKGDVEIEGNGKYLVPGFIDGHCHIESTMMTPEGFAELVIKRGTTTVFADPHEIANTSGMDGLEYMFKASQPLPIDIYLNAPSCVPASSFETPREELDATAIKEMFQRGWCRALGEVMNYPGVITGDPSMTSKLMAAGHEVKTGHAPGITGKDLNAYMLSGCNSDHESSTYKEGLEKLRKGMWLMIREGASEHNLQELAPLIKEDERRISQVMMVSDDLNVSYLYESGHMDVKLRMAQELGISFMAALRMITLTPARYFQLYDRGAIAPGYKADMVLLDSTDKCNVQIVWKEGEIVAHYKKSMDNKFPRNTNYPLISKNVKIPTPEEIKIKYQEKDRIRVIGIKEGQVITESLTTTPTIKDGFITGDAKRDISKMIVVDRNTNSGRIGKGFVKGMKLKRGAIATSVAHDAHNFSVIGQNDEDMIKAIGEVNRLGGGFSVALEGKILASLPLPVGGLMSPEKPEDLLKNYKKIEDAVKELGCDIEHPFMVMAFLSLSVIPELKLTDQGYINLGEGGVVPLQF